MNLVIQYLASNRSEMSAEFNVHLISLIFIANVKMKVIWWHCKGASNRERSHS